MTGTWQVQLVKAIERGVARMKWLRPAWEQTRTMTHMTHRTVMNVIRDTRKTMYVVAAFYVAVGFLFAIVSLAAGALLGTFLGFVIISGTLAATALLRAVLRTDLHLSSMNDALDRQNDRLNRMEATLNQINRAGSATVPTHEEEEDVVNLANAGVHTEAITAATLDRDAFPRLVSLLGRDSDDQAVENAGDANDDRPSTFARPSDERSALERDGEGRAVVPMVESVASKNVRRAWKLALREGDLVAARQAFSALLETSDRAFVDAMRSELVALTRRTERSLRRAVSECVSRRDVDALIALMKEIRRQLPGHPMADECARLEPALRQRATDRDYEETRDLSEPDAVDREPLNGDASRRQVAHATP